MKYKFIELIEQAINDCKLYGNAEIHTDYEGETIYSEWEAWDKNSKYDVIAVYFYLDGIEKYHYQIEETKVLSE